MAPPRRPEIVIGLDVGKSSHWACAATRDGEVLASKPVANRENALDSLFAEFPGALVVVDQVRNIGALALSRARAAGMPSAYLPGLAAHEAARLFGGDAKTDERDAMVIAKTALGIPDALLPVPHPDPAIAAARALAVQRDFLTRESTRSKNRLRSILLEPCPEFESLVDLSDVSELRLMAALGGPRSVADAGRRRAAALARGARRGKVDALVGSVGSSTRPDAAAIAAEDRAVRFLARRIAENAAELQAATAEISALLERDETYRCLLTIPGIGPKTASELAISVNIDDFPNHDRLASYCGLAPRNRQSGTSVSSVSASRQGNKRLKNLLIFSCNCLARTDGRWGEYYARCRDRGMPHGKALKAVARKRLKVIYAVMRDKVPYVA
ncbi:IS110 family transposase [Ellagibacter isourolithinifaciens]|uniref:IS110 family transposase n=1 Tax=Ellagibacter isourolithinifaciens TaxID=2137581 RepID=UPI003AF1B3AF